jgi:hypothetical protein
MPDEGKESKTLVVTTEDGVVLTGKRIEMFEAKIIKSIQRPFYLVMGIFGFIFILLIGGAIFLRSLNDTVNNTDKIVTEVAGPDARAKAVKQQAALIQSLVDQMDCRDQENLQKLIDNLVQSGFRALGNLPPIVEPDCKPKGG